MALIMLRQRHPSGAVSRDEIAAAVRDCARMFSATITGEQIDGIVADLETRTRGHGRAADNACR